MTYEREDEVARLNAERERESFDKMRRCGLEWLPTRELLESHIRYQIDTNANLRSRIKVLAMALAAEAVALIVIGLSLIL